MYDQRMTLSVPLVLTSEQKSPQKEIEALRRENLRLKAEVADLKVELATRETKQIKQRQTYTDGIGE